MVISPQIRGKHHRYPNPNYLHRNKDNASLPYWCNSYRGIHPDRCVLP